MPSIPLQRAASGPGDWKPHRRHIKAAQGACRCGQIGVAEIAITLQIGPNLYKGFSLSRGFR
jgi:hypothetical protein